MKMKVTEKKISKVNHYKIIQSYEPAPDSEVYKLGEQVRQAFNGLTNDLFDHIQIEPFPYVDDGFIVKIVDGFIVKIVGSTYISLCAGPAFDFLSSSVFSYRPKDKEPWELAVNVFDGFGASMSVRAKTPRECIRAMVTERKKDLKKQLTSLNRFRNFEDYTRLNHLVC